jgi:hypothetical protein
MITSLPPPLSIIVQPRRYSWGFIGIGLAAGIAALGAAVILSFTPGGDLRALRQAVFRESPAEWNRQIELGVGRLPVAAIRAGLRWVDLDPKARTAARALRSADVGVYQHRKGADAAERSLVMNRVVSVMERRSFEPVVTVRDGDDLVQVFLPKRIGSNRNVRTCVLVMDEENLILVSARLDVEALADLVHEARPPSLIAKLSRGPLSAE